jgi:hypothetical protein
MHKERRGWLLQRPRSRYAEAAEGSSPMHRTMRASTDTPWQIVAEDAAVLTLGPLVARVQFDPLGVRWQVVSWNGQLSDFLGAMITAGPGPRPPRLKLGEAYVRGSDLIASYAPQPDYPFTPHFRWQATWHPELGAVQIEMILSVQTDWLDSRPEATVTSVALGARVFSASTLDAKALVELVPPGVHEIEAAQSQHHLVVFRQEELGISYAEMVHRCDFVRRTLQLDQAAGRVESLLFPERLEKGVIRRGRVSGWLLPAEGDCAAAVALARQFDEEPPPLTA